MELFNTVAMIWGLPAVAYGLLLFFMSRLFPARLKPWQLVLIALLFPLGNLPKLPWGVFSPVANVVRICFVPIGFVIIPLMRKKFVEKLHWLDEQEMMDFAAIAQSSPGAIAVNASILIGYRIAGLPGALVTVAGTVLKTRETSLRSRCLPRKSALAAARRKP